MVEEREEIFGGRVPELDDITARVENLIRQLPRTRTMLEYWNNRLHSCVQQHGTGQHLLAPKRLEGQATAVEKPVLEVPDDDVEASFNLVKSRLAADMTANLEHLKKPHASADEDEEEESKFYIDLRKHHPESVPDDETMKQARRISKAVIPGAREEIREEQRALRTAKIKEQMATRAKERATSSSERAKPEAHQRSRTPLVRKRPQDVRDLTDKRERAADITAQAPSAEDQFCDHCGKPAIFAGRSCYKMACTKCAFSSMCRCGHQHLRCDAPSDLTPPETAVENRTDYLIYQDSRHYGEDPQALKRFQEESFQEIYDIVYKGGSTGNAALDRAVRHYGQAEDDVADSFQVPDDQPFSLEDYFKGQDNDFQQKNLRSC